ncbi:MAG: DUF4276 family protein [Bacteroidales bacterium]|nr:DUF4276 family protein [Bacteroidales bacterium]MCF8338061.1 DUF4276 family protein [Bacteroidales bacterium]
MVKIGFIVEGHSDQIILKSSKFQNFLKYQMKIDLDEELINIGNGKAGIKKKFVPFIKNLNKKGADYIFVLLDQDDNSEKFKKCKYTPRDCPREVIDELINYRDNRHYVNDKLVFVVMERELEAWFLADNNLGLDFEGDNPEEILNPSEAIARQINIRSHTRISKRFAEKFSIERAAEKAPSAKRFIKKIEEVSQKDE